ncbi:putative beta-1,3-galactosyltransferase 3 [Dorcoceras hygrometricum]|uniref:Putative beta-1,3-galactosyltransferase 3 n=1 Tax=Dorcoceras hygrometricum TaxID=472368 RepID=A0A2Z7CIZ0_9LAMI|nr:putative beta-1,3-galactosyltransferase 3 [Dorcoceras hygrometricum]
MVVDLIGIYGLKGPYCTLTMTDWFLQALSVIPRGSWGDVARRFTMIRWAMLLVQADKGVSILFVDRIGDIYRSLPRRADVIVTTVGARHKCQQDDIPHIDMPTVASPSTNLTESTAQLRASIDRIQFEQVQTTESIDDLKAELSKKITSLEIALAQSTSCQEMVFRAQPNDVRREVQIQKAALTQEMTAFRLETQEGITNLPAQLSEIIAYINRERDDKKGEDSSSGPQPEDRSRPGGSGGSSSEPSKKGGGSYKGRGSRTSGFSRWFS